MPVLTITPQLRTTDLDGSIRFYTERVGLELDFRIDFYAGIRSGSGSFHLKLVDTEDPRGTRSMPVCPLAALSSAVRHQGEALWTTSPVSASSPDGERA
jgi:catechol 2,3-dioxygenase-like lactoylglutathione lyase family enzyme